MPVLGPYVGGEHMWHTLTGVPAVVQKGLEASSKKLIWAFTAPTYSPYPVKYAYLTVMIQRNRPAVLNDSVSAVGF